MLRSILLATAALAALGASAAAQTATPAPGARAAQPPARGAPTQEAPAQAAPAQIAPAQGAAPTLGAPAADTTVEGVTVTGRRSDFTSGIDRRSYNIASDLQSANGSIADALRNVPSVEVDVQGNVSLRGDPNVTILIDGRPSGAFAGEGRGDALQALPADQIERVEVLTNPSAAFRPDGTGGVINLVTKKNRRAGRYATVRGSVGTEGRGNIGVSGAYTGQKLTLSGDAGYRRIGSSSITTNDRERLVGGQLIESRQDGTSENEGRLVNARLGAEYNLDDRTRLSAELRRFEFGIDFEGRDLFEGENAAGDVVRAFTRDSTGGFERANTAASASWRRRYSGTEHELVADLTFERTEGSRDNRATIAGIGLGPSEGFDDIRNDFEQDQARFKLDYNRPLRNESRLRTGYEFERQANDYDSFGQRGPSEAVAIIDPNLTNLFAYDQDVHAAYATYERPFGTKLRAQGGLRLEQVNIDIGQVTLETTAQNDYLRAYPSGFLRYELSDTEQLSASYSRRTTRPRPEDLNPFIVYIDPFNLRSGNPDLDPQETDSFELGYQKRSGPTYYLATAFYRDSRNGVTDVVRDLGGGVLLTTRENLTARRGAGLELVANGQITPKLTYNLSGNLLYEEIGGTEIPGLGLAPERSGTAVSGRGSLSWQPTAKDFFQLNASITGRRLQPQGFREPTGIVNLGYRRKVDEKLSLLLTAQDVLDSFKDEVVIDTPILRDRVERTGLAGGRSLFVGLTYSFSEGPPRRGREPGFEFDTGGAPGGG